MAELAFLFDVDNTLLDNDRAKADMAAQIERLVGPARATQFWEVYEQVRLEGDVVDYPRTLRRFRTVCPDEPTFPEVAALVLCYPYETCLYPGALDAIAHLKALGTTAILSDGDPVYQAAKIARAGLVAAVDRNLLIYVHKEAHLEELVQRFGAERYVLVDDKPRILAAAKGRLGECVVTVHVRQGHYALAEERGTYPAPDLELQAIGDLRRLGREDFRPRAAVR